MPRAKRGFKARRRRNRVLAAIKGFRGKRGNCYTIGSESLHHAWMHMYRSRKVRKSYFALVVGVPAEAAGTIDARLRRQEVPKGDRPKVFVGGKSDPAARTDWRVIASAGGFALVVARPRTGRTHQIRAHVKPLGHPILVDLTYGDRRRN